MVRVSRIRLARLVGRLIREQHPEEEADEYAEDGADGESENGLGGWGQLLPRQNGLRIDEVKRTQAQHGTDQEADRRTRPPRTERTQAALRRRQHRTRRLGGHMLPHLHLGADALPAFLELVLVRLATLRAYPHENQPHLGVTIGRGS